MKTLTKKTLLALGLLSALTIFAGCKKDKDLPENFKVPRLMVESRGVNYGGLTTDLATLPISGTTIPLQKEPLIDEFEIANVELVKVDLGLALMLQLSEKGSRALYRGSVTNMGGRIVLTVNGTAIGVRRIDGAMQSGTFYTFVEVDDEEIGQLVIDLKESLAYLQANKD